ncbi:MAG TPA: flagellar biosynthetic protein FliR [Gemmatimonadaceae bacterium]|nr:flagellar biosynthetic protein FliR [Gemmatimonadaceae bacterium]
MFDLFAPGSFQTFVLLAARIGGLVTIAPVFSTKTVPVMLRAGITILLTVLLQPIALASATGIPRITPETFMAEMLIGFALGLGAALLVGAASVAGDLIGTQIGLSGAAILDPINNTSENVLGSFGNLFAITMMLAVDGHLVMIDAVARSAHLIPVGSGAHALGLLSMVRGASVLFSLGLQFAAPVIAAVLVANTALAILSRAAPALNLLSVAFPIQIGIGLFALAASIPFIGAFYHGWSGVYNNALDHVFSALMRGTA